MEMKRIISIAIAFALLAVSFAMVNNARAQVLTDSDNTTQIRVNAAYPKLYALGLYQNDLTTPVTDTQIDPLVMDYYFIFDFNYSLGSANCDFLIQAWHDGGVAPSTYPALPGDAHRNTAFEIHSDFNMAGITTTVNFPAGDLEIMSADGNVPLNVSLGTEPVGQERYRVYVPVTFGAQIRAAEYGGVLPVGPLTSIAPITAPDTTALNNIHTWDFSVAVRDAAVTSAAVIGFGEFGVYRMVSISVANNPTANAPPGSVGQVMSPYSQITYSSNTGYYVNVTLSGNLLRNGVGPDQIPATSIYVQNVHTEAAPINSDIAASAVAIPGVGTNLYVWGATGTPDTYILPSGHGTTSAGPASSNYFSAVAEAVTNLEWSVDVPGATPEGFYWTTIFVTIDGDIGLTI